MAFIVIVGTSNCKDFAHACYVAEILESTLPNFKCSVVPMAYNDWANWITDKNATNGWNHSSSPVIYRELTMLGGKEYYIGGIDQFWEYICDYYGLEFILSKTKLAALQQDNVQKKNELNIENDAQNKDIYRVCICGAEPECLSLLIPELIKLKELHGSDGICIYLYPGAVHVPGVQSSSYEQLLHFEEEPDLYASNDTYHVYVQVIDEIQNYLSSTDLMIILGGKLGYDTVLDFNEYIYDNAMIMTDYADIINNCAQRNLRIIVAYPPTCYNATILTELVTSVRLNNIIAITADLGLEALSIVSQQVDVPISHLSCPPVYGFVDINRLIDIGNIVERVEYFRPSKRIINERTQKTSLKVGEVHFELRPLIYLTHNLTNVWKKIHNKKMQTELKLGRFAYYSKVRAITDLLKHWYSKEPNDAIISAGILTYGKYGIKNPIVFSQPIILSSKRTWIPYENFPKPQYEIEIEDLVSFPMEILEMFYKHGDGGGEVSSAESLNNKRASSIMNLKDSSDDNYFSFY
ncbi:putative malate dehydrogenase 1B [Chrysoperla carnea]|uniref:putative malate dehydrogenase 1B n=1 Tax=Chrysoperla carnea TaxID=189513 RepID=UPI001D08E029|nr:putative malate dehydrogenase 1B [Chrysoperla carnea]